MKAWHALFALLVFPGLLYALPMGWFMLGAGRKLVARFQGRIGPPISQPFYDVVKLLAKQPVARVAAENRLLTSLPLLAVGALLGALALLPVFSGETGFVGDLVLLVGLLELPPLCMILAGYASRSIYGEVGATREATLSIASNIPFLAALVAMASAAGSLHLSQIVAATPWLVRLPALLTILLCLPVKLRTNPFSLSNAEQEILSGPLTEFDGRQLALWELVHGLEWVALTGFVATLAVPVRSSHVFFDFLGFVLISLALVVLLNLLAAATARLKLWQATRLLWRWASLLAAVALATAFYLHHGGY
jgi:NADH-quinone oxidoreductase subunit H